MWPKLLWGTSGYPYPLPNTKETQRFWIKGRFCKVLHIELSSEKRMDFTRSPQKFYEAMWPQLLCGTSGYPYPLPIIKGTQIFQLKWGIFKGIPNMLDLQYWGYVVKIMTSPQNFYEAERPLMGTHQLWVPIGPTIQAGIEIAQSQVFFYQSST